MKCINSDQAIYCQPDEPLQFGDFDIFIADESNTNTDSFSYLGLHYTHPDYVQGSNKAHSFLASRDVFKVSEIEVYEKS